MNRSAARNAVVILWHQGWKANSELHHLHPARADLNLSLRLTSQPCAKCRLHAFSIPHHPWPAMLTTTLSAGQTCEWHKCFTKLSFPAQDVQHQSASVAPAVQTCFEISARCHGWSRQREPKTNQSLDKEVTEGRETKYRCRKWSINYSC